MNHPSACWAAAAKSAVVCASHQSCSSFYDAPFNYEGNQRLLALARPARHALCTDELAVCWRAAECCSRRDRDGSSRCDARMLLETSQSCSAPGRWNLRLLWWLCMQDICKNMEYLQDSELIYYSMHTLLFPQHIIGHTSATATALGSVN